MGGALRAAVRVLAGLRRRALRRYLDCGLFENGFARVRVEPEDQPAVKRLARYIMRPPISLERIRWSGEGEVFYQPKGGHDGRARQPGDVAEAFDPADFLARVIMHIPEPRRHLVR